MPKVTFSTKSVVRVYVRSEKEDEDRVQQRHEDVGLIPLLLEFLVDEEIYPAVRGELIEGEIFTGFFASEGAAKIEAWLLKQGAERNDQ